MNKDQIINMIIEKNLDQETIEAVYDLLKVDKDLIKELSILLSDLEFVDFEMLSKELCVLDRSNLLKNALSKRIEEKDFPINKRFNIIDLCYSKGMAIGMDVFSFLMNYKPSSEGKLIGKGECLFRILMKGLPSPTGDLDVFGRKLEVKFNSSRLRGMVGFDFTDASIVASTLDAYFIKEADHLGHDISDLIGTDPCRWNFVSGKRLKPYLLSEIITTTGMDHKRACYLFAKAFSKYFSNSTDVDIVNLSESLSNEIDPKYGIKERVGYSDFIYKMCAFALKYYSKVEGFDGILFTNDQFECFYMTSNNIKTATIDDLAKLIRINMEIRPASLSPKAGIQGSSFGIRL